MLTWSRSILHFFGQTYLFIWWILPHNFTFPKLSLGGQKWNGLFIPPPSNHSSFSPLWNVLLNKTIPLLKGFCSTSSSVWWCSGNNVSHALRIVMAKTRVTECCFVHQVKSFSPCFSFHIMPKWFFLLTDIHASLPLFLDGVWNPICIMTFKKCFSPSFQLY